MKKEERKRYNPYLKDDSSNPPPQPDNEHWNLCDHFTDICCRGNVSLCI